MKFWVVFLLMVVFIPVCGYGQAVNANEWVLSAADADKVDVNIRPVYKGKTVQPGDRFVSPHGDTFSVDAFRFYVSNFSFTGNRPTVLSNCHLFDLSDISTYSFVIQHVPSGIYTAVELVVGVDSAANTSGANAGDLDPVKGMYWAWNSGYIMAKLEGRSNACKTVHHAFEFHIGGYVPPYNTERKVTLKIPEQFPVGRPGLPAISITADIAEWFTGGLDLSKVNSIMIPGKEAALMADKYAKMLFIEDVSFTPLRK